ncbi:YALI0F19866p [Yarrowia lipolytica CLIB122]|jgi:amino acid transporter|uniref:YALI0F19866p n=1 Tax=Yarrowia lipolytica (strain CLIB 122 / E 150) TaxID=284591 RepID=Q6C122_YARLI|nr:YALI0F19866p [Yarrowia lipolytica CLIB122]CAG78449.1 YALI0F19866p [Yarrowia lipolytica CLIB122]VBB82682.1 General amino acid permease, putative [Yarrowia lipolytica]|eukprot:XP_505640.1 YALI0F19866p [Yarrowia lipolytica CLIB122]
MPWKTLLSLVYMSRACQVHGKQHVCTMTEEKTHSLSPNDSVSSGIGEIKTTSKWRNFVDSFKEADLHDVDTEGMTELEISQLKAANSPLQRSLKDRHVKMIAIGGSIGTGLFVGSGGALAQGGPAALLIAYTLVGSLLFCTINSLGELAVAFPVSGAFATFSSNFIDPAWGFAMGWNYTLNWFITFPLELVAASITVDLWREFNNSNISPAAWVAIFYVAIVSINFFGAKGYGEAEFIFSIIKVVAVVGFILFSLILVCGGVPGNGYIGGKHFHDPGAFANSFKGVAATFINAAFAFGGTELVGLAAAETENPRRAIPSATKQVFWRCFIFYFLSLLFIGLIVPYNSPELLAQGSVLGSASPFVIAIKNAGVKGLPSVMNVVIMVAVLSVGNSAIYGCSRTVAALAAQGMAPKIFGYIDRTGRPLVGIIACSIFGLLAFVCAAPKEVENEVFFWLLSVAGLSGTFTWGSVNLCHIRWRLAIKKQGRELKREVTFKSRVGIWGSIYSFVFCIVILAFQFWVALFPVGGADPTPRVFFQAYLCVPVILVFYFVYKIWKRTKIWKLADINLDVGRREFDYDALQRQLEAEKIEMATRPWYVRWGNYWC